jgi:hypothetical protein
MAAIYRPTYCTREEAARALGIGLVGYDFAKLDRAIQSGADAVDRLCQRRFYVKDATYTFDWPNYQYAYPWRLWLKQYELAAQPTLVVSGTYLPSPVVIPSTDYFLQPINDGPPYTSIELRRDRNSSFGNNTTPQNDIGITGSFGYWMMTQQVGTATSTINIGDSVVQVSDGAQPGVGDAILVDAERMLVVDSTFTTTGVSFLTGITTAVANDNVGTVSNGAAFTVDEQILVDTEVMLITMILGNTIIVRRAFSASILTTHSGGAIWARRQISVLRGALGTTAASHSNGVSISVFVPPAQVKQLNVAEAVVSPNLETGGYASGPAGLGSGSGAGVTQNQSANGQAKEPVFGSGLPDLRMKVLEQYGRQARSSVI